MVHVQRKKNVHTSPDTTNIPNQSDGRSSPTMFPTKATFNK